MVLSVQHFPIILFKKRWNPTSSFTSNNIAENCCSEKFYEQKLNDKSDKQMKYSEFEKSNIVTIN